MKEIKKQIKKQIEMIEMQIKMENMIYQTWKQYKDCEMKTAVIHQAVGIIRGLEIAKQALESVLIYCDDHQMGLDQFYNADRTYSKVKTIESKDFID